MVTNQIRRAQSKPPLPRQQEPKPEQEAKLITTYHHGLQPVNKILRDGNTILQASCHTKGLLKSQPKTALKQPRNSKTLWSNQKSQILMPSVQIIQNTAHTPAKIVNVKPGKFSSLPPP